MIWLFCALLGKNHTDSLDIVLLVLLRLTAGTSLVNRCGHKPVCLGRPNLARQYSACPVEQCFVREASVLQAAAASTASLGSTSLGSSVLVVLYCSRISSSTFSMSRSIANEPNTFTTMTHTMDYFYQIKKKLKIPTQWVLLAYES